jgi:hypothetical protein
MEYDYVGWQIDSNILQEIAAFIFRVKGFGCSEEERMKTLSFMFITFYQYKSK